MDEASRSEILILPPKESDRLDWQRQIDALVAANYHKALGKTEDEYRQSIPEFISLPPELKGRFDKPILVDPRPELETQLHLLAIENDLDGQPGTDIQNYPGVETPSVPYQVWVSDGTQHKGKTAEELRGMLSSDERGLTTLEGIAFYRENKHLFTKDSSPGARYSISLAGSQDTNPLSKGSIPHILYWVHDTIPNQGEAEFWCHWNKQPNTTGGWPTCAVKKS